MAHSLTNIGLNHLSFLHEPGRFNCLHTDNGFSWVCAVKAPVLPWVGALAGVFHQFPLVAVPASVLWNPGVLLCYLTLGPTRCKAESEGVDMSFFPYAWIYASLKKCYSELVGNKNCISNIYCTLLFSGYNLVSLSERKQKTFSGKSYTISFLLKIHLYLDTFQCPLPSQRRQSSSS